MECCRSAGMLLAAGRHRLSTIHSSDLIRSKQEDKHGLLPQSPSTHPPTNNPNSDPPYESNQPQSILSDHKNNITRHRYHNLSIKHHHHHYHHNQHNPTPPTPATHRKHQHDTRSKTRSNLADTSKGTRNQQRSTVHQKLRDVKTRSHERG